MFAILPYHPRGKKLSVRRLKKDKLHRVRDIAGQANVTEIHLDLVSTNIIYFTVLFGTTANDSQPSELLVI